MNTIHLKKYSLIAIITLIGFTQCKPKTATTTENTNGKLVSKEDVVVFSADDNKAVIEKEITAWEFAKKREFAKLAEIYADDYVGFFGKNVLNASQTIQTFQNATINSYRMSNIKVKPVTSDVAVVYYDMQQDIVGSDGLKWVPNVSSSVVYAKRKGAWRSVFYNEIPRVDLH